MADVSDNEELIATRKLHGLNDNLFEEEIEVGEYVRTKKGAIGKLIEIDKKAAAYYLDCLKCVSLKNIVKHSKQLIDLIENKDILKIKIHKEIIFFGINENTSDIKYKELIENIKNGEYELLQILTHQQFETNCYKVGGENE